MPRGRGYVDHMAKGVERSGGRPREPKGEKPEEPKGEKPERPTPRIDPRSILFGGTAEQGVPSRREFVWPVSESLDPPVEEPIPSRSAYRELQPDRINVEGANRATHGAKENSTSNRAAEHLEVQREIEQLTDELWGKLSSEARETLEVLRSLMRSE